MFAKDSGDFIDSWAFHIHEVGIGALPQALLLVSPLLDRDEGDPLCVLMGKRSPPFTSSIMKKLHCFILHVFDC